MKKIRTVLVALIWGAAASWSQPEPGFHQSWRHYSYGVRLLVGAEVVAGGLNGKSTVLVNPGNTTGTQGKLLLGAPDPAVVYGAGLAVRMDRHRISFAIAQSPTEVSHDDYTGIATGDLLSIGLDYRFDPVQDRPFRPSFGGGVHFASRDLDPLFLPLSGTPRRARLSGNGIQCAGGVGWWWRERLMIALEGEYRLTGHRNIGLGDEGVRIKGTLWEHQWLPKAEMWIFF